jgi:GrpE
MTATAPLSLVHHTSSSSLGTYLLAVAALVIGVLAGFILRPVAGRRPRSSEPVVPPPLIEPGHPTDAKAERDLLVRACIRARDLAGRGALRQVLGDALMRAGVTEVDPTGQPFDPDLHCSVGVTHTADPGLADTVAAAERVGYEDRGRQLRAPEVIVFTAGEGW